ncbi:succinate dehydrogenase, cytochrome b556 subunit [Arenicella xantha]|uniref:Succinate dehydrogenase cytochrome b556 subunit n=1 Tax=Arenicella xantha TaxID=644221 RepID=A0A395JK36_9GAMM|nr:succinate dehydrogenase, cytochrome b556 subunit [Arenicella xantha]RBP49262.1 succinate dehydrogenase subunit C [Arenicella xantha]
MQKERPLSPHLQVYKPQLTSMLSILHRGTGVVLTLGIPFLVYWLMVLAAGPEAYAKLEPCLSHMLVKLALVGWTFALFYHLCNGIRHLFWDVGRGFEMDTLHKSGWLVLFSAALLTAVTCYFALVGGAA